MSGKVKSILIEAEEIINGARQSSYGTPEDSFNAIAAQWEAYLNAAFQKRGEDKFIVLTPMDVANMMVLLKVARNCHTYKRDNAVDIAGYAGTMEMLSESQHMVDAICKEEEITR